MPFLSSTCCWENESREPSTAFLPHLFFTTGSSIKLQWLMRYPTVYINSLSLIFFRTHRWLGVAHGDVCIVSEGAVIQISASRKQFWIKPTESNKGQLRIHKLFDLGRRKRITFLQNWKSPSATWTFVEDKSSMNCKVYWGWGLAEMPTYKEYLTFQQRPDVKWTRRQLLRDENQQTARLPFPQRAFISKWRDFSNLS